MKRVAVLVSLIGVGGLSIAVAARQPPAAQPPAAQPPQTAEIEKVKDNLYMVKNGGGNTGVFITSTGVVVVDTKNPGWGQRILEQIKTVTTKPVTMIINTHTHGDHTGSNNDFPATVDIVAQENTKANMERMTGAQGRGPSFTGENAKFLPKRTFKDKMTLLSGRDAIDLYYFGPGHTNGDALVVFRALRAMHAGDLFAGKNAPIMDANNGGSGVQYPRTLANTIAGIKDVDTIITGHSTVMTWNDLREYSEFITAFVTAVQDAHKAGKSEDAAAAELKLPDKFKDYNMARARADVTTIYTELKK
jgi:glyoxylase-like metal-dependent hydrolase (beta-lactamase superfamily II)